MPDPGNVYTERWFRERVRYRGPYRQFAASIEQLWGPRSMLDVGCGAGYFVEWFAGRVPVRGVDGSAAALAIQPEHVRRHCFLHDLTEPPPSEVVGYEFAVCVEVAEHIPASSVGNFLRWFEGAERLFFTAAPPGQGGLQHINERPPGYWISRLARLGFRHRPGQTERWRALARSRTCGCPWVIRNAMFFEKEAT